MLKLIVCDSAGFNGFSFDRAERIGVALVCEEAEGCGSTGIGRVIGWKIG